MPIRTKRWNDAAEADDGLRVLVCRYRPRGVRKDQEPWDAWMEDLGPSRPLHAAFYGKEDAPSINSRTVKGSRARREEPRAGRPRSTPGLPWPEYRRRYLEEMMQPSGRGAAMLGSLAVRVAAGETVTLLCSSACVDAERCHRSLLADLIERAADRRRSR